MVINVEYNQLDPLLRASGYPEGDVNCETGYSPFPGNINQVTSFSYFNFLPPPQLLTLMEFAFSIICCWDGYYAYLHCS